MCRRRLLKSNFYINYGGTKKAHGETVIVSPFVAGGDSDSFELYTRSPWVITNNLSWLTVSSLSNKSGKYTITITAAENQAYSERNGVFTAKTLDDRFSIVVSVSQQAKPSVRYIEIVPATASISSLGTTSFTCILHDNGTETDVTNLVEWSSSDTNAATISNGSATGCNNTKTEKQVTITAEYDGLSATATLNVAAGVVSWRNYRILIGAIESTKNSPVNLDATNISSSVSIGSYIDEYVNEVKLQTWSSTESSTWSIGDDTVARLEKETETSREVYSVYNSGAFYPNTRTTEITATTTYGSQTFTAAKIVNVAPQGLVAHYISVEPTTATIGSTGEVQLTVLYHTVTDGVDDGGVDVTTSAGYTDNGSDIIDVNTTGKVSGSGSETGGNATVTVSYPDVESVDVSITVRDATVDYRNLRVIPLSMTLGKDDVTAGEQIQAYVDIFVNNVFSEELEVTTDAGWTSQNTNVASVSKSGTKEVVKPVYGAGYFPTTRTTQIQASYLGSAATCDVTVEPEGRIERYIEVTPSSVALGATGSESLKVKLYTKTDGVVDAGVDVTTSCSYASDSQIITVNDSGVVTANNTGETEVTANITVSYPDVDSVIVPAVSSHANIEHELLLEPQGNTTLGFEEDCAFKLYYITKINGTEVSREEVTSNITWDPIAEEKGYMAQTTFMNVWFSTDQTTVDVCATYNGIKSNNVVLTLNGAESITHALVITPSDSNINYNGTSQMSAEYVTYVNGTEYSREPVQPSDVSWSENSTASTISNSGLLTANNTSSSSTVSATVTGTYNGVSGTANVTIGKAPGIDVSTPSNWHLSSGAGSDEFYVKWVNLKPNTTIVLDDKNIVSYSPVEIPITSSNYTGGTVTINFSYDENPNEEPRKIYLYATGTGLGNETKTDSDYFEQSAKTIERNIQVSVDGKVTSNGGGTCDYVLVSWTGLTVGTWIDIIGTNAGVSTEIQVTATTGSVQLNNQPSVTENEGSSRTIRVDAKWREDNSVSGYDSWTQNGDYVPPVVDSHIYIEGQADEYEWLSEYPCGESEICFTISYDSDIDLDTVGYYSDGGTEFYEVSQFQDTTLCIEVFANATGDILEGNLYISGLTTGGQSVVATLIIKQPSLSITDISITDDSKILIASGQMCYFEVRDQNDNLLDDTNVNFSYYNSDGTSLPLTNNVIEFVEYSSGKFWFRKKVVNNSYDGRIISISFYSRECSTISKYATIEFKDFDIILTPSSFPSTGGNGTIEVKTYGDYSWRIYNYEDYLPIEWSQEYGTGNTTGITFTVDENTVSEEQCDSLDLDVSFTDEYGNRFTNIRVQSNDVCLEAYVPPVTPDLPWYVYSRVNGGNVIQIETGLEIRYDNNGDFDSGKNEFDQTSTVEGYPSTEAEVLVFGHTSDDATTRLLAQSDDWERIACRDEDVSSRDVQLMGTYGPDYGVSVGLFNDINGEGGTVRSNQQITVTIDRIEMVTNARGKTLIASTFSPMTFTITTANTMAEITAITFPNGSYVETLSCDTTTCRGEQFGFHFNYGNGVTRVKISWDGAGISNVRCGGGLETASTVDITNGSIIPVSNPGSLGVVNLSGLIVGGTTKLTVTAYDDTPFNKESFYVDIIYQAG